MDDYPIADFDEAYEVRLRELKRMASKEQFEKRKKAELSPDGVRAERLGRAQTK